MTPLLNANRLMPGLQLKLEYLNPSLSIKHRAVPPAVFESAEERKDTRNLKLVILTSGTAGISVAWAARRLDCEAVLLMPESAKSSVINYSRQLGADVQCHPHTQLESLFQEYKESPDTIIVDQLADTTFIDRYRIVGEELLHQNENISAIVVGAGSAASSMGIALATKEKGVPVYVVEPAEAPVLSGKPWQPHGIPGLAPPIPTRLFRREWVADILHVDSETAWATAHKALQATGEPVGPSSGATIAGALELRERGIQGDIVSVCPSHLAISL
ncbi:MAG: pyridoxal-phosphate dependent enzyme [Candidatus Thiodiazotropha sp.]